MLIDSYAVIKPEVGQAVFGLFKRNDSPLDNFLNEDLTIVDERDLSNTSIIRFETT